MAYRRASSRRGGGRRRSVRRRAPRRVNIRKGYGTAMNPYRRANARNANCKCPGELTPTQKFMLAQLDPFDVKVGGAKIPDSNSLPSISNVDTDIVNVTTTNALDTLDAVAFRPFYKYSVVNAGSGVGTVSWGATFAANAVDRTKLTQYAGQIELTRPVAHAVRITCPLAPTSTTGFVHIGLATESTYGRTTWDYPTTVAQMSNLQFYKRLTLASLTQTPFTIINKWIDDTAFRYSDPSSQLSNSTSMEFQTDYGWASIVIMVEAQYAVGVQTLSCEHLLISEGIPQRDGVFIGSQAAPNSPGAMATVSGAIASTEPFHSEADQDSYINQGLRAMAQGAAQAGEAVFNNVALPLLRQVGYAAGGTAAVTAANAVMGLGGIPGVNANPRRLQV
uniref:Capsid protein n=1 Tax=Clinch CRESS virus 1 TaxID=2767030 RepID=A0A7G8YXB2_9VIRU|nr:capsid protein [Clinch CRESS virus 1]